VSDLFLANDGAVLNPERAFRDSPVLGQLLSLGIPDVPQEHLLGVFHSSLLARVPC
jgi:hypothetical protein